MPTNAQVAAIYAELQLKTAQFHAALGDANSEMKKFAAQTRQQTEQARGSFAILGEQIGVAMPRELRRFVAELPGVTAAMSAAFDAVAIFALIDVVVEAGRKVADFIDKNEDAARKNAEAWEKSTAALKLQDDELQLSTIKIDNQIAQLEGKPKNGLAEALAEARVEAMKLSTSIRDAIEQEQQLLKSQTPGMLMQLVGNAGFGQEQTMLAEHLKWSSQATTPQQQQQEADSFVQALQQRLQTLQGKSVLSTVLSGSLSSAGLPTGALNDRYDKEIEVVKQMISQAQLQSSVISDTITNNSAQGQLNGLQSGNEAVQDQMKAFEETLKQKQATENLSVAQEIDFWRNAETQLKGGGKAYTDAYTDILTKIKGLQDELFKEFNAKGTIANSPAYKQYMDSQTSTPPEQKANTDELTAAITKQSEAQAQLNEEWTAAQDKVGLLTGAITPHEAALDAAAAHADDYRLKLEALEKQLAQLQANDSLASALDGDPSNQAKETQVQTQIAQITNAAKIQQLEDAQNTLNTTWTGMVDSVWDELIKRAQDTQQELARIATQFVDGINSELAKGMTGHKMDFGKVFEGAAQGMAKTGLQSVEGLGLKALGLGGKTKRDGSSEGSSLFVTVVGGAGSMPDLKSIFGSSMPKVTGPSGSMSPLASTASKGLLGMLNNSNWASSLFGGNLFGSGGIFDHFATGGDAPAGVPIRVGELGPEDISLPLPGHVTPNRDIHNGGITMNIDAKGTDPSLTKANFQRSLTAVHAQAVHDASRAMVEKQRRTAH